MNSRSYTTMIAAALMICSAGCGDTIVHDVYVEVAPPKGSPPSEPAAVPVTFDDLNLNMKIDVPFREEMLTDRVKGLVGKRVRLTGIMHGSALNLKRIDQFVLLRNRDGKYGPGILADTFVEVKLKFGTSTKYQQDRFEVEGTLRVEPKTGDDGNTWRLYILEEATLPNQRPAAN